MKKSLLSFIIAISIMMSGILLPVSAENIKVPYNELKSAQLTGSAYIKEKTITSEETLKSIAEVINSSKGYTPKGESIALFSLNFKLNDKTVEYHFLKNQSNYYIQNGSKTYKISFEDLHSVVNAIGSDIYKYRSIPAVSVNNQDLRVISSSYSYLRADGKFYKTRLNSSAKSSIGLKADNLPKINFSVKPKSSFAQVYSSTGKMLFKGSFENAVSYAAKNSATKNGYIKITAAYENKYYKGEAAYRLDLNNQSDKKFEVAGLDTNPGEVLVIKVNNVKKDEKIDFKSDIDIKPNFFDNGEGGKTALMPVSYYTVVGEHYISISSGGESSAFTINVKDKKFQIQNLNVSTETAQSTIENQNANIEYENAIAPLRQVTSSQKYFDSFMWPLTGRVTTEFGMIRYVNNKPTSSRHGAIDIAAPLGTDVKAAANGKILYSGYLTLTGNTVLIEHGYGLKSWYYHMDSRSYKTGDIVNKGDIIGTVGTTGFSTGPHLHFGMSVNNVFINPSTVIDTDLLDI